MATAPDITPTANDKAGLFSGISAFLLWGLYPIYFVAMEQVAPLELVGHRIIWSIPFGFLILVFRRQVAETFAIFKKPKTLALLTVAAIALAANWGVYIWAIQKNEILQASLGYYINPLLYVLVGVVFFKDRFSRLQGFAVLCAIIGVAILTIKGGVFPGISLFLAASFGTYGVLRKQIDVGAMPGLFVETCTLFLPALMFFAYLHHTGVNTFGTAGLNTDMLLIFAGPLTVMPLLGFAFAARRISLSALGILQYIGPTGQFICGLYYGDSFTPAHAWCFGFIWLGVGLYSFDAIRHSRAVNPAVSPTGSPQIARPPDSR